MSTEYSRQLAICEGLLKQAGLTTLDYALHVPMLIDRRKMLEAVQMFPRCPMFRSLYGNYAGVGGTFSHDYKLMTIDGEIDTETPFLSTADKTFPRALAFLEERFP